MPIYSRVGVIIFVKNTEYMFHKFGPLLSFILSNCMRNGTVQKIRILMTKIAMCKVSKRYIKLVRTPVLLTKSYFIFDQDAQLIF